MMFRDWYRQRWLTMRGWGGQVLRPRRRQFLALLVMSALLTFLQLSNDVQNLVAVPRRMSNLSVGYDHDQFCKFPVLDPYDASILAYVSHPYQIYCQNAQPAFTLAVGHRLVIDAKLLERYKLESLAYRRVIRTSDHKIEYDEWSGWYYPETPYLFLKDTLEIRAKYGLVSDATPPTNVYMNSHPSVFVPGDNVSVGHTNVASRFEQSTFDPAKGDHRKQADTIDQSNNGTDRLNVIVLGFDSISRSNFVRNMPKTYRVLMEKMNSVEMRGYTKVDDNTFPNILALLTGRKVTIHSSELDGHFQTDFIDQYPFLWKDFKTRGYVTGMAEEYPGVLSYAAKGFDQVPTDWYLQPFGVSMERNDLRNRSSPLCFGNRPIARQVLDATERFLQTHLDRPHFLFSFYHRISHDRINDIEMLDPMFARFFEKNFEKGVFNNTVLIVMSDHGNRFDAIRRTLIGRIEERMPYISIYLPDWFREKYSSAWNNLLGNEWRLTSQFDVYETLTDVRLGAYGADRMTFKNRGRSLFTAIDKGRSCSDAGISPHFCVCQEEESLAVGDSLAQTAAAYAIRRINSHLVTGGFGNLCVPLSLDTIISAQRFTAGDHVRYGMRWHYNKLLQDTEVAYEVTHVRVTFKVAETNGVYEALVKYVDNRSKDETAKQPVDAEISRINAYGKEGVCIVNIDRQMEKFCYCRHQS